MQIQGALWPELESRAGDNKKVGVVLVDEPQGTSEYDMLVRQAMVLTFAKKQKWPVWFITIGNEPTHSMLANAAPASTKQFSKPGANAFEVPEFRLSLNAEAPSAIVVMGQRTDMCVQQTVMGGQWREGAEFTIGAIGYGYEVLTCEELITGGKATWKDISTRIKFYTKFKA